MQVGIFYQLSQNDKIGKLIEFFKQFTKAPLQDMVCKFILLRAEKDVNDKNSFVYKEKNQRLLPYLFEEMLTNGTHYNNLNEKQYIQAIVNILSCVAQVYRHIYECILTEKECMKWWNSVGNINERSDIITYCFTYIFIHRLVNGDNRSISNRIDIHWLSLSKSNLRDINFRDADLIGADLIGADLSGADLSGTHLSGADLSSARLRGADLSGANLSRANLIGADLSRANLSGATLRDAYLIGAYLIGADLSGADLSGADLAFVDLRGADLRGATLPDGFKSDSREEQVRHLKEMNIEGLVI